MPTPAPALVIGRRDRAPPLWVSRTTNSQPGATAEPARAPHLRNGIRRFQLSPNRNRNRNPIEINFMQETLSKTTGTPRAGSDATGRVETTSTATTPQPITPAAKIEYAPPLIDALAPLPGHPDKTYQDLQWNGAILPPDTFFVWYKIFAGGSDDITDHLQLIYAYHVLSNNLICKHAFKPYPKRALIDELEYEHYKATYKQLCGLYCKAILHVDRHAKFTFNPKIEFPYLMARAKEIQLACFQSNN